MTNFNFKKINFLLQKNISFLLAQVIVKLILIFNNINKNKKFSLTANLLKKIIQGLGVSPTKLIPKGFLFISNLYTVKLNRVKALFSSFFFNTNCAIPVLASNIYNKKLFDLTLPKVGYNYSKVTNKNNLFVLADNIGLNPTNTNKLSKWYLTEDLNKIISAFFKSIYCLISKPKYINTNDKIIIEILYYITIPDNNVFKWYNFIYISKNINIKNRRIVRSTRRKKSLRTILNKKFLIKQTLFKLNNSNIANIYFNKFTIFFKFLSSYFRKPIEFNLIRLHKSDYDSNILAQLFILILKRKNIRIAINKIYDKNNIGKTITNKKDNIINFEKNNLPATISGLYIHIGGRLMREPIIPRLTTKKFEKGAITTALAPGLEGVSFLDSARITKKNKKGAFTIKIAYAQNLVK